MNSRRQTPGDDLIQREKETQNYVWQVLLPLYGCCSQVGLLNRSRTVGGFVLKRLFMLP